MSRLIQTLMPGVALIAAFSGGPASAQATAKTISSQFYPESEDGRRTGCSIAFEAVYLDHAYRQGQPTIVDGSFSIVNWPEKAPALTLKLVLNDATEDGGSVPSMARPATISLVRTSGESNVSSALSTFPGETAGSTLAAFSFDGAASDILIKIVRQHELTILFNREKGGIDTLLPINLDAQQAGNDQNKAPRSTVRDFATCTNGLMSEIEKTLPVK